MFKNISISVILNTILTFISVFLLCFAIFRLLNLTNLVSALISLLVSIILSVIIYIKNADDLKKSQSISALTKKKKQIIFNLAKMNNSEIIDLFAVVLEKKLNFKLEKTNFYLLSNEFLFIPFCTFEEPSLTHILQTIKQIESKKEIIILTAQLSQKTTAILNALSVKIIIGDDFFSLFNETKFDETNQKEKKNFSLNKFFKRPLALKFLCYGIFLMGFSLICFYPIYYVLSGSLFIFYGLFSLFFGSQNPSPKKVLSEIEQKENRQENS